MLHDCPLLVTCKTSPQSQLSVRVHLHFWRRKYFLYVWESSVNVSLCCQPYLTVPTRIILSLRTNSVWHQKRRRRSRSGEWQHRCIIHLFAIPHFSLLIITRLQKPGLPSIFFPFPQMSSVWAWRRWCRWERMLFQPEFEIFLAFGRMVFIENWTRTQDTDEIKRPAGGIMSHRCRQLAVALVQSEPGMRD